MFKPLLAFLFFSLPIRVLAQSPDSVAVTGLGLKEVQVSAYLSRQPLQRAPTSVAIITKNQLQNTAEESLLPALNAVPGIRMEERSPGSYRLSIRGSLLRSPFGIRNVKVYLDEFPLTDAGGNTYLNLVDPRALDRIEVLKGPDGSLFGANSGGVVLLEVSPETPQDKALEFGSSAGSYGMVHQNFSVQKQIGKSDFQLKQAFQRADGYRENSAMRRHYLQLSNRWEYRPGNYLKALAFYSDLKYETPGGLTLAQYETDPRQARPAAGPFPGAVEQQARIENRTWFGGLANEKKFSRRARLHTAVFGSLTGLKNPFITNYELRDEKNLGLRSYLEISSGESSSLLWKWNTGLEAQRGWQQILNYDNDRGTKGALQAGDKLTAGQHFYFTRFSADLSPKLKAEAAISLNYYHYKFQPLAGSSVSAAGRRNFNPEWMPRLGLSYAFSGSLAWRASLSRGYSPPTLAEIRPSDQQFNTRLEAETGYNVETGFRFSSTANRFQADVSVYNYRLRRAIVRRLDASGAEFFTNAGGTSQTGLEAFLSGWLIPYQEGEVVKGLQLSSSFTFNYFRFSNYRQNETDLSGNRLTGTPQEVVVSGVILHLPAGFIFSGQHNFTGRLPLNDANTVYAGSYHLVQAKLRWLQAKSKDHALEFYAGADNILNQKFSLGNDLNAFGNRYYNAAPLRSWYVGASINFR